MVLLWQIMYALFHVLPYVKCARAQRNVPPARKDILLTQLDYVYHAYLVVRDAQEHQVLLAFLVSMVNL